MNFTRCLSTALITLLLPLTWGQAVYVPPELEEWREWVLHDQEQVKCPSSNGVFNCVWPGRLELLVSDGGGEFAQNVEVFAEQIYALPGDVMQWPLDVSVAGIDVPVLEHSGRPAILLKAGKHRIAGRFEWSRKPDRLMIGNGTALLSLKVDQVTVERPRFTGQALWIQQGQSVLEEEAQNQINISVYRLITDGATTTMDIRLQLEIAGESREETIGQLVPKGFEAASMTAPLPARLDDNGNLKIQARPGTWIFEFQARRMKPLDELTFEPQGEFWPEEEIWSYQSNPVLRATEVRASNPVDPSQVGVPTGWEELPAFRMNKGDIMSVAERQRGRADSEQNHWTLNRQLWLDFDRGGFTARDNLSGTIVRDWRLDLLPPFDLKSARLTTPDGDQSDLLVTQLPKDHSDASGKRGIEIRVPVVQLTTLSRIDGRLAKMPVAGWDTRFDSVNTAIFLPPGNRLLKATGVDIDGNSWWSQWDLLNFFLVLIVSVAVWRLFAPWLGVVALVAMALSLHENGAPQWAWLNLIAALVLVKLLPAGSLLRIAQVYRFVSIGVLVILILPFAADQLRAVVYPQLENTSGRFSVAPGRPPSFDSIQPISVEEAEDGFVMGNVPSSAIQRTKRVQKQIDEMVQGAGYASGGDEIVVTASRRNVLNRYDKNAKVQTGPGVPSWSWHQYNVRSSGPVEVEQTMKLWIAPPLVMRIWRLLMVLLMAVFLGALIKRNIQLKTPTQNALAPLLVLIASGMFSVLPTAPTYAQTPSTELLEELRNRLTKAADCTPNCIDISRTQVKFTKESLTIDLIVQAGGRAAVPLPGRLGSWMPTSVRLNGQLHDNLRITNNNVSELQVDEGVHRIALSGPLPNANSVVVSFPLNPRHIQVSGQGWEMSGVNGFLLSGGSLTLIRQQDGSGSAALDAIDVEQFPVFVVVERRLQFDLDWSVETNVYRRTPKTAAINLRVPLLSGESVTSEQIDVKEGHVLVSLANGVNQFSWTSTLARVPELVLSADENQPWQNSWRVETGASWRLEHAGVPELNIDRNQDSNWIARFWPWPGESLALNLSRPTAVDGSTLAIDSASINRKVGARSSTANLSFQYRATRGGQHAVTLAPESELISVSIDGQPRNLALEENQVRLPITPGKHDVDIEWRRSVDQSFIMRGEEVNLGISASNQTSIINLPNDRWILWTQGPRLGPAVLYWSELLVFFALAYLLAKLGRTPLRTHHWMLLGLGFSTFFWPAFAIVAAALLALAWRERHEVTSRMAFNSTQVILGLLVFFAAVALVTTIPLGLLGTPNMHVTGNQSNAYYLTWFLDRSAGEMPQGHVVSAPIWVYKALILLWALWLTFALLRWLPWMWQAFSHGGYWKAAPPKKQDQAPDHSAE